MKFNSDALLNAFIFLTWITLLYSIFYDYSNNNLWRVLIWISLLIISTIVYLFFSHLSKFTNFILSLTILANILGEIIFEFYYTIPIYDKILHFSVPFAMVFIIYDSFKFVWPDKRKRLFYSLYLSLSIAFLWEFVEIAFDYLFDAPMIGVVVREPVSKSVVNSIEIMSPFKDTVYDMGLDILGAFSSTFMIKRKFNDKSLSSK